MTDEMKNNIVGYIEECDSYIKKKKTPPIPVNVERKTCMYCPYVSTCNKES